MRFVYKGEGGSVRFADGAIARTGFLARKKVVRLSDGREFPVREFNWWKPSCQEWFLHQSVSPHEVGQNLVGEEMEKATAELQGLDPQPALSAVAQIFARLRDHYSRAWGSDEFLHEEVKRLCREASVPAAGEISEAEMRMVCAFFGRSAHKIVGVERVLEYRRKLALKDHHGFKTFDAERTCPPLEVLAAQDLQILSTDLGLLANEVKSVDEAEYLLREARRLWIQLDPRERSEVACMATVWLLKVQPDVAL